MEFAAFKSRTADPTIRPQRATTSARTNEYESGSDMPTIPNTTVSMPPSPPASEHGGPAMAWTEDRVERGGPSGRSEQSHGSNRNSGMPRATRGITKTKEAIDAVKSDVKQLGEAVKTMQEFFFLRRDSQPVYGLQDWTESQWAKSLREHPEEAKKIISLILKKPVMNISTEAEAHSAAIKMKLSGALSSYDWEKVCEFQNKVLNSAFEEEESAVINYLSQPLLSHMMFNREFPLGVEDAIMRSKYKFAIRNSGLNRKKHKDNQAVTFLVYGVLIALTIAFFTFLFYTMTGRVELWDMDATDALSTADVRKKRNKARGTAASLLSAATFSLTINACLDKFGRIDPSSSTVFIGMTLGGTWGFVLDNMLGSDEGFREYLWNPYDGMRYAMGLIYSQRFGRYIVTILFDMFFTVIMFKMLFSKLVQVAGFTVKGREWIANGFCSALISVVTFQVYANMTRFEWAYPSGDEHHINQWISGQTMTLNTVIMCMVYFITETRCRVGEPGINDPNVKIVVVIITFGALWFLQAQGYIDPSEIDYSNATAVSTDWDALGVSPIDLPLKGVCEFQNGAGKGLAIFVAITCFCLGFVIFGTSQQTLTGLKHEVTCCLPRRARTSESDGSTTSAVLPSDSDVETASGANLRSLKKGESSLNRVVDRKGRSVPIQTIEADNLVRGKVVLFMIFFLVVGVFVLIFAFTPFYSYTGRARNRTGWGDACKAYNKDVLTPLGLS